MHDGGPFHIESSPLICRVNQWIGFYMMGTFVIKKVIGWWHTKKTAKKFRPVYFKGIVNRVESRKYDIRLVSRILWRKRIIYLKEWDFDIWYSPATFRHNFFLQVDAAPYQWKLLIFIGENLWSRVLEAKRSKFLWKAILWKWELIISIKIWRTKKSFVNP